MKRLLLVISLLVPLFLSAQYNVDSLCRVMGDQRAGIYLLDRAKEYTISEPRMGIEIGRSGLEMAREKEEFSLAAGFANEMGRGFSVLANYDSALSYFFIAEGFVQLTDDPSLQANILVHIGGAYNYLNEYKQALRYYNRVLGLEDSSKNHQVYLNVANIYQDQGNFPQARENLMKSLEISERKQNRSAMAATMSAIGENFKTEREYEEAQGWFERALSLYEEIGSIFGEVVVLNNLGELSVVNKDFDEAKRSFETALLLNGTLGNPEFNATLLTNLGVVNRERGNLTEALKMMRRARKIAIANGYPNRLESCLKEMHRTFALQGSYADAYTYQSEYQALKDSLNLIRFDRQNQELQARFETKQREKEQQDIEESNLKLRLERQRLWLGLVAISLVVVALLVALVLNRYWVVRRLNLRLEERTFQIESQNQAISASNDRLLSSNKELKEFAYIVSHDLKDPLRMIGSYVTLIERRYIDMIDEEGKEFFEYATRGVKQMKQLLDDLLKYMVVETNDYELEDVPLNEVLSSVKANLLNRIKDTNADVIIDQLPSVHGNRSLLILLFQNLISNALKFRSDNKPELRITVSRQGKQHLFAITDNGIGISKQYQDRIFSIFYRVYGKHQYEGTGIGLSICQKIVGLHGGKIWVESEEGKGSTFYFTLGDMVDPIIQPSTAALNA